MKISASFLSTICRTLLTSPVYGSSCSKLLKSTKGNSVKNSVKKKEKILPIQTFVHFDEIIQFFTLGRERISPFSKSQGQIQLKTTVSELSEVEQISHLHHPLKTCLSSKALLRQTFLQQIFPSPFSEQRALHFWKLCSVLGFYISFMILTLLYFVMYQVGQKVRLILSKNKTCFSDSPRILLNNIFTNQTFCPTQ